MQTPTVTLPNSDAILNNLGLIGLVLVMFFGLATSVIGYLAWLLTKKFDDLRMTFATEMKADREERRRQDDEHREDVQTVFDQWKGMATDLTTLATKCARAIVSATHRLERHDERLGRMEEKLTQFERRLPSPPEAEGPKGVT